MKTNEVNTAVAPQDPTAVPQTPVVEQPVAPVQPVAPEAPVAPMPGQVQTAVPVQPVANHGTPSNGFANLVAKLKSFGVGPIVTVAVVAVVLVGGIILSVASSTPKAVFKNAINNVYKGANVAIDGYETYLEDYDLTKNALLVSGDFSIDTNVEDMEGYDLNKISLGFNAGVDYKNEVLSLGANLKGNKETVKLNAQMIDNELYVTSSLFKEVLKLDSDIVSELGIDIDFEEIKEEIETAQKDYDTDPETYDYLVKTIRDALVKSINSEYMEKEKDEIDVLDKELKVTKYSYVFDEDAIQDLVKKVAEYLLEEEDFAKTFADAMGLEKKDVKELLKTMKKEAKDIEFDGDIAINLYTRGLFNSYAGIGLEVEGKEYFSLYTDGKNVEFIIDDHDDSEYGTKMVATVEKDGKGYKVEVKENKEKIMTMEIKEATDETIDAEIDVYDDGEKEGTIEFYISAKETKDTFTGEYKFKMTEAESKEYVGYSGKYTLAIKDKVEKMSIKNAVSADELDLDALEENIEKVSEKDEALGTLIEDTMTSLEEEMLDLNYKGMSQIYSSDVEKILAKKRATVLYVGNTYYSSYSEVPAYTLLDSLVDLQDELGFYSYYLSEYSVDTTFENLVKDVQYVCPTTTTETPAVETPAVETPTTDQVPVETPTVSPTTCTGYPAIYLIKDGKVQKAFRQTVTYEDLKAALAEIGIN